VVTWPYPSTAYVDPTGYSVSAWDEFVTWETRLEEGATELAATVAYVRDKVLRTVTDSTIEDEHIRRLILAATTYYEEWTSKALRPQTWTMILDRFPYGRIRLERPPFLEMIAFGYVDASGASQSLLAPSPPIDPAPPPTYLLKPAGRYRKAELWPPPGGAWPATQSGRPDAVTVTYRAGTSELTAAPWLEREIQGIALCVADFYTNRAFNLEGRYTVSTFTPSHFWQKAW